MKFTLSVVRKTYAGFLFCIFQTRFLPWIKQIEHTHFLKADNSFCRKPIILLWLKERIDVTQIQGRGKGKQSSPIIGTRGNTRTPEMGSTQELAVILPVE